MKVIFLVGGPGSGKDQILRFVTESHPEYNLVEIQLDKIHMAIYANQDLPEISETSNLIVNGNAERIDAIVTCQKVLEAMGFETSLLYVYTTNEASKARNDARIARGAKTFTEEQRQRKYASSTKNLQTFSESFTPFWLFNNSTEAGSVNEEVTGWLVELNENIDQFLSERWIEGRPYEAGWAGKKVKTPTHEGEVKHEFSQHVVVATKDGEKRLEKTQITHHMREDTLDKYNSLNVASETYTATAVDNSRGNINVAPNGSPTENPATVTAKVLTPKNKLKTISQPGISIPDQRRADPPVWEEKLTPDGQRVALPTQNRENKKNIKTKSALPPPNFFDSKMGMVPSGSLGITAEYKPSGTPLSELRKKMRK